MSDPAAVPKTCPQCGATLPSEATEGLCPRCLLDEAMHMADSGAGEPANPGSTIPMGKSAVMSKRVVVLEPPLPEELATLLPKGAFHVESFLGQGGMGAVYKGTQVRLKRSVAIKIMRRDEGRDHEFEKRFEHEAQAMARLNHPNIVSVIDFGEAGADFLYIVMEFIDGADLMDVIRTKRMTQEMALTLLPQICDALQFAHDHGIVHRDIKPSNIMLTRDGHIKMADFGLAKRFDGDSHFRTQTGTGMGTPDYAAPEQFIEHAPIDHRADIYALGVMIYQMITGTLPRGVWKPPSQRAEVDPQWDDIVSHAMQSDPADRYQQAREIKTDVSRITPRTKEGSTEESAPTPVREPLPPRRSRNPVLYGIALLALVVGAFYATRKPVASSSHTVAPSPPPSISASAVPSISSPNTPPTAAASGALALQAMTKDAPFVNSLGMKFVPVPIVRGLTSGKPQDPGLVEKSLLFSIWDTRVKDYEVFAKETKREWTKPDFEQGPTHPAVNVSWDDAEAFCAWLTDKERKAGKIKASEYYRLPSDHEWSCAVGIGDKEDAAKLPEAQKQKIADIFPWGTAWPPPDKTANIASEELRPLLEKAKSLVVDGLTREVIANYRDGYAFTSPVESFAPNALGLHDMGGNVQQWTKNWNTSDPAHRALRGASWATYQSNFLFSSHRPYAPPAGRYSWRGFRCVLDANSPAAAPVSGAPALPSVPAKDAPDKKAAASWQPFFTDTEWKESKPGQREFVGGRLHVSGDKSHDPAILKPQPAADGAIRARIQFQKGSGNVGFLARMTRDGGCYRAQLSSANSVALLRFPPGIDHPDAVLGTHTLQKPLQPGDTLLLELRLKGRRLTVLVNDTVVIEGQDSTAPGPGVWGIIATDGWYESVEVQTSPVSAAASGALALQSVKKDAPFVNTLSMKFVPVPGTKVLFSIWDTRVRDYAAYAKAAGNKVDSAWKQQSVDGEPVGQGAEDPVVGVSWEDAQGFCRWLTQKEISEGKLPQGAKYRLPSDEEWSLAVGLPPELGKTPAEKHGKNSVDFPWGKDYPPTRKVGNFEDEAFHAKFPLRNDEKTSAADSSWIKGYNDGYATISPVGSFPANGNGLYDMSGNVRQWCEDWFDASQKDRVLRGGAWVRSERVGLLSSHRFHSTPDFRGFSYGFRCVLEPAPAAVAPSVSTFGPWQPLFTNAELNAPNSKNREVVDGRVHLLEGQSMIKEQPAADGAIRARIRLPEAGKNAVINARVVEGSREYKLKVQGFDVLLEYHPWGGQGIEMGHKSLPSSLRPGDPLLLELRLQGEHLTVLVDGAVAIEAMDSRLPGPGKWGIMAADGWFESVEVQTPLPAAAPIMNPSGSWQPLFTDAEWQKTVTGKKEFVDGRVHMQHYQVLKPQPSSDGTIRARIQIQKETDHPAFLVRMMADGSCYKAELSSHHSVALVHFPAGSRKTDATLATATLPKPLKPGDILQLELRLEGDRLTFLVDGVVAIDTRDSRSPVPGRWGIIAEDGLFESVEVQTPLPAATKDTGSSRREEAQTSVPKTSPVALASKPDQSLITPAATATKDAPFVNSLGMKFVPVPGTDVLFCIHETRTRDFAAYIEDGGSLGGRASDWVRDAAKKGPDLPIAGMNWEDAQAFCLWLSRKEGKTYRLPTDREWSYAVGIGEQEKWDANTTPATLNRKVPDQFPWGTEWPPPKGAGNYRDETFNAKDSKADGNYINGYDDGFATLAPVMSFTPNRFGLYDLGGNVSEFVEDWLDTKKQAHVFRGGGFTSGNRTDLLSSARAGIQSVPGIPGTSGSGFRVVLSIANTTPVPASSGTPSK